MGANHGRSERNASDVDDESEALRRLSRLYDALSRVNSLLVRARDRHAVFDETCRILVEVGEFRMAWVGWHEPDEQRLLPIASAGDRGGYLSKIQLYTDDRPEGRGPAGIAFREASPYVCNDVHDEPSTLAWLAELKAHGYQALACFPISDRSTVRGTLCVYAGEAGYFKEREVRLLAETASSISFALMNLRREESRAQSDEALSNAERAIREAEARAAASEALLQMAGGIAKLGGWSLRLADQRVTWSNEVCEIHEVARGQQPTFEEALQYYAPEHRGTLRTLCERCVREGIPFDAEAQVITARGRRVWVRAIGAALRDDAGVIIGMQGACQDVTERHKLKDQLRQAQKMEAIGQLAGGIAHDFNNLLSVILSYSSLVLDELKEGDPIRADLQEVFKAGERAGDLTHQLLAFSRRQILQPRVLDVGHIVSNMEKMLRRMLGEDVELMLHRPAELGRVNADPTQIEQIVMNLAVNARDAMPHGGKLSIEVANIELADGTVSSEVKAGVYVMLAVTDSGTGMSAETRERIFEPFFTTKEPGKGTGLGLSTVFGIVKQSQGHVWVYSEIGRGTTFKIYLPSVEQELAAISDAKQDSATLRGSETILLVEDDDSVRNVAQAVLRRHGYTVLDAQNAGEAFLLADSHAGRIDLLLTDVIMPRLSGRELAERLRPIRADMRILYMSGYTTTAIVHQGVLEAGIAFLPKPFTPDVLLHKVRALLNDS